MDASAQTRHLLWPGADVTLNIGLGKGSGHTIVGVPHRLRVITKLLPQILKPGYVAHLELVPRHTWTGEPMLVVQGTFVTDINAHDILWQGIVDAEQDCIACWLHADPIGMVPPHGFLFGPRREAWGEFNINFFSFLGDKHE